MSRTITYISLLLLFIPMRIAAQVEPFKAMSTTYLNQKNDSFKYVIVDNWIIKRFRLSEDLGMRSMDTIYATLPDKFKAAASDVILTTFEYGLTESNRNKILDIGYETSVKMKSPAWQSGFLRYFDGRKLGSYKAELDSAYRLCEINGDEDGMASITLFQGNYYRQRASFDSALFFYKKSLSFYLKNYTVRGNECGEVFSNIGNVYFRWGRMDSALFYFQKSNKAFTKKDYISHRFSIISVANAYKTVGNYDSALHYLLYLQDSLPVFKEPLVQYRLLRSYAYLYVAVNDLEKADDNAQKYLGITIFNKDTVQLADAFATVSFIKYQRHRYDSALHFSMQGIKLLKPGSTANNLYVAGLFLQHGINWMGLARYDSAAYYLRKAYAKDSADGASIAQARDLYHTAMLRSLQNDTASALKSLVTAKALLKPVTDIALAADIYKQLAACAFALHKTEDAWQYQNQFIALNDSLNKSQNIYALGELDVKYKLGEEKSQVELLRLESQRKNTWVIISACIAALAVGGLLLLRQLQQNKTALKVKLLEQKAVRAQLEPHFIFNVLQSVKNEYETSIEAGERLLANFSVLVRGVLNLSAKPEISLADEILLVQNYLEIESQRFERHYALDVRMAASINAGELTVPSLILQPLAENVVKHGVKSTNILLNIYRKKKILYIEVESEMAVGGSDTFTEKEAKGQGMGLKLTVERLNLFNKKHRIKNAIQFTKTENNRLIVTLAMAYVKYEGI